MKRFGVLVGSAALGAALVVSSPAAAFRGGSSFGGGGHMMGGGGHMMGGMGGHPMMRMGGFNRGFAGFNRGMFTGRSVFVPGRDRIEDRIEGRRDRIEDRREGRRDRIEDRREGRRDRIEDRREGRRDRDDRFRHRRFFVNRFDNFAFFGAPFAYDYAEYGNGCWRWDGWQWINICNNYGGYNYGY